ncbi:PilZ domain-containing protein, partial [Vibrio parahaemolyticus]|nr:PilZ domain-containing protein [Vibrio parahaemolyticus]
GQEVRINFRELQLYDKKLPLMSVPYRVIRVSPDGCSVQLVIDESSQTMKVIAFFNSIIEHNQDKLIPQKETLPSNALLERLHCMLLSRTLSTPIFISKSTSSSIKTPVIGVNLPLPKHIELFARLGHDQLLSLEPIFKGRTSTLIAEPIKRVEGAQARHQDIYISAV